MYIGPIIFGVVMAALVVFLLIGILRHPSTGRSRLVPHMPHVPPIPPHVKWLQRRESLARELLVAMARNGGDPEKLAKRARAIADAYVGEEPPPPPPPNLIYRI